MTIGWEVSYMYQQGDLVVYGSTGVCKVEGFGNPDPRDRSGRQFYLLKPLYQAGVIYTPVEGGKVSMRPVMSAREAQELIALIPGLQPEVCRERTLQLLAQRQLLEKSALVCDCGLAAERVWPNLANQQPAQGETGYFALVIVKE